MWTDLEAYVGRSRSLCVGPCWPMLSQKIRKMGTARKHCKTQDILMVGGLSWGYVDPPWGYVGVSWGQRGPILGLCWPILRATWAHLGAMLANLGPMLGPSGADVGASWGYIGASGRSCAMFAIVQEHVEWHRAKKHSKLQGDLSTRTPYREVGGGGGQRI